MTKNLPQLTYDEAIAAMENILEYFTTRPTEQAAAAMAIDALQEKQKRESRNVTQFDQAIRHFESYVDNNAYTDFHQNCCRMAIDALRAAKAKWELEHPIPLTFEQLMQVKSGTYIWTKVIHGCGIADGTVRHKLWVPEVRPKTDFDSYGKDWLAYLTEPPHGTEYLGTEFWEGENV